MHLNVKLYFFPQILVYILLAIFIYIYFNQIFNRITF